LNYDSTKNLTNDHWRGPQLLAHGDDYIIAWSEKITGGSDRTRVKSYQKQDDGSYSLVWLDGGGADGLQAGPTARWTSGFHLFRFNSKIYATFSALHSTRNWIRVVVYDGTSWTAVDGGGDSGGLNYNLGGTRNAFQPRLVEVGDALYVTWVEYNGTAFHLRAKSFNGDDSSPTWTTVDGGASSGWNYSASRDARLPFPISFNDKLYITWIETDGSNFHTRVGMYDPASPSFSIVDGNSASGLSVSASQASDYPRAIIHQNTLYVSWDEVENDDSIHSSMLASFNGSLSSPVFSLITSSDTDGFRTDASTGARWPSLFSIGDSLFMGVTSLTTPKDIKLINLTPKL
jgi:hypothetical protein